MPLFFSLFLKLLHIYEQMSAQINKASPKQKKRELRQAAKSGRWEKK